MPNSKWKCLWEPKGDSIPSRSVQEVDDGAMCDVTTMPHVDKVNMQARNAGDSLIRGILNY